MFTKNTDLHFISFFVYSVNIVIMMRENGGHFPAWCNDRELLAMLIGGNEKPDADWLVGILENKWSFIAADIRAQIICIKI